MRIITFILPAIIFFSCQVKESKPLKIATGSCSREYSENQLWAEILNSDPDLLLLTGDNIYGDSDDMSVLRDKYDQQKSHPDYQKMLKNFPIIGTWDDHDYGLNDGGKEFSMKTESKKEFMRFFDLTMDHPINDHEGVYHAYDIEELKIILLDTRYFRDPLIEDTLTEARYTMNPDGDILGDEQWQWLENQLASSESRLHLIASSIQFLSDEHGYEKWSNFPSAQQRMKDLLAKYPDKKVMFISGDRHISEFSVADFEGLPYRLVDFTSSGLTHSWGGDSDVEPNRYRVGELIRQPSFGLIEIDWETGKVKLSVIGNENELLSSTEIIYSNL